MTNTNRRGFLKQSTGAGFGLLLADACRSSADEVKARDRLRVVTLEGSPAERGVMHGQTLKEAIHALVKVWKADLAARYRMPADDFIGKFLKRTNYLPAMQKWTPDLVDEIRGIAKGADLGFETMLVFQLIDEYWVQGPGVAGEHCSSLGIHRRGHQPACVAQNMDLEGFRDGFQTVLHIKQAGSDFEQLVLTQAGLIGLNGMNNRAIGICCNTLSQLTPSLDGLPVACVVRGVLQQPTEAAALKFLHDIRHASGQNYVLGGREKVHDLECSAGKVSPFAPHAWPAGVWHTNHPLANDDYSSKYQQSREEETAKKSSANSAARLESLTRHLASDVKASGLDLIKETLAAHDSAENPVCRLHKNSHENFTFASTIMVLADKPEFYVAPGPPDTNPYQTLSFSK